MSKTILNYKKPIHGSSPMSLYNTQHITQFNNNIDALMELVKLKKHECEPELKTETENIIKLIYKYLKINKRKIYGGIALDMLLPDYNSIYTKYETPDIDYYSPDPMGDLINLCNILNDNKFKFVRGREAMHKETYGVYVNNRLYCNITYVPKNIYSKMPFKIINDLYIVHPHFLAIDYLRIFTDPLVSYWRLKEKKAFERFVLLQKNHPLPHSNNKLNINNNDLDDFSKNICNDILEFTKNSKNSMVHIGLYAYNYFLKESGELQNKSTNFALINIPYYEIVSINYKTDVLALIEYLKEKHEKKNKELFDKIKIEENYKFFQYLGDSATFVYNDMNLCTIYCSNARCIPYLETPDKILIGTFNYVLLNALVVLMKHRVNNNNETKDLYYIIVSHLIELKNKYLKKNKLTIFDVSPFQDFTLNHIGSTISPEKERQLIGESRKKKNKAFLFSYEPANSNKDSNKDAIKYIFTNSSGNVVINKKKSKLFGECDNDDSNDSIIESGIDDMVDSIVDNIVDSIVDGTVADTIGKVIDGPDNGAIDDPFNKIANYSN